MKTTSSWSLVIVCSLSTGCVSSPEIPKDFDFNHTTFIAGSNDAEIIIDGLASKGTGAVVGGAAGAGVGLGFGVLSCLGTGFLFPVCIGMVVPVTTAASAVGGGVYGAVATQGTDDVEAKREMLTEALGEIAASRRLATLLEQKAREHWSFNPPGEEKEATMPEPEWMLRVVVRELATVGSGPDVPYSLKASALVEIAPPENNKPVFVKTYQGHNPVQLTTAEWRANDDEHVETALDRLLAELATHIFNDLMRLEPVGGEVADYFNTLKTFEGSDAAVNKDSRSQMNLFDDKTGLSWIIVPTLPVNLGTAKNICGSFDAGGAVKSRIPSLQEFDQLWHEYKGEPRLSIFNKKEYNTSDEDYLTRFGYTKTFSFADGTSGNLYAADLTCVSK